MNYVIYENLKQNEIFLYKKNDYYKLQIQVYMFNSLKVNDM